MSRYGATEYNPGVDGSIAARVMSQIDIPRQLLIDERAGRDIRSGPVESEAGHESVLTVVWGRTVWDDGTRVVLAWYEMDAKDGVGAPQ